MVRIVMHSILIITCGIDVRSRHKHDQDEQERNGYSGA
jgi:hypothetical protein